MKKQTNSPMTELSSKNMQYMYQMMTGLFAVSPAVNPAIAVNNFYKSEKNRSIKEKVWGEGLAARALQPGETPASSPASASARSGPE